MVTPILVPKSGMTEENITVVEWLVPDGTSVSKDELVVVLETSKSSVEVESPTEGLVFCIRQEYDTVNVGDVLGAVANSREEYETFKATLDEKPEIREESLFDQENIVPILPSFEEEKRVNVEKETPSPASHMAVDGQVILKQIPFTGIRKTIARNLVSSLQSGAQLTVVAEADMTELDLFRKELILDNPDDKITFVDLFLKLVASVLKEFPIINASIVGDEIIYWGHYHIGVAVSLDDGLVVPVVKNADQKSLLAVCREIKKLSRKAQQKKLNPTDYESGTFTLSSGGKNEVEFMTPIINPPQSAILGIGKIGPKPAVHNGEIVIRTMTYLCLTHDHRVVDGVVAGHFIGRLKEIIKNKELFRKLLQ